jgi:transposase
MRIAPAITLSSDERTRLESQARSRSLPVRVAECARIVLFAASGQPDKEIAAGMAITPKKVSRWRKRFLALGVPGLQKDAPRPGRKPTIGARLTKRVVTMTTREQPANATHWSTRTMAATVGISEASVRRIWRAHGLKPHRRVRPFQFSPANSWWDQARRRRLALRRCPIDASTRSLRHQRSFRCQRSIRLSPACGAQSCERSSSG